MLYISFLQRLFAGFWILGSTTAFLNHQHVNYRTKVTKRLPSSNPIFSNGNTLGGDERQQLSSSLVREIVASTEKAASQVVSSFLSNMPDEYFQEIPKELWVHHMKSIVSHEEKMSFNTEFHDLAGHVHHCFFFSGNEPRDHISAIHLPPHHELVSSKTFDSIDGKFAVLVHSFAKMKPVPAVPSPMDLNGVDYAMYDSIRNTDGTSVRVDKDLAGSSKALLVSVAAAGIPGNSLLAICNDILNARGFKMLRAEIQSLGDPESSSSEIPGVITLLRMRITSLGGHDLNLKSELVSSVSRDLKRAKWIDPKVIDLGLKKYPDLGMDRAEIIVAFASMLHGPLTKVDPSAFKSIPDVIRLISGNPNFLSMARAIADLFLERFNPKKGVMESTIFKRESDKIRALIATVPIEPARIVLSKMMDGLNATLRTNFFNEDRYALSFRVDPRIMVPSERVLPFGVFFMHGRHFNGFHNRFRDIARGGLRVVTPLTAEQYSLESTRQYDEAYGLSFAQQLKNKDIPEGGSKGVVLVNTPAIPDSERFATMRNSVKAYCDSMLDLMVEDSLKSVTDYYKKDEIIYLGPDEQIIPSDIEWIIKRAGQRGYPNPAAFMSSKKEDGFNHKEFGVTSEGVVVFLDIALRKVLNIDPHMQPFSVKITGGPDGDVAGNLMKILFREYGDKPKIVGVSDGLGVAEDPEGLNHDELLRLFKEGSSIVKFDKSKLSKSGICLDVNSEEGVERRNSMHFRVKADVFVPGGGRPNTINGKNWEQFLLADGTPSSKLVVEGANIFTTPEARNNLYERANVTFVKDSSANKCGVITSSCEIQASMLLAKEEFMANKPRLVKDVLDRLRLLARLEGELLFKEYMNQPGSLVHFSERISNAIAKVTDAVTDRLSNVNPGDDLFNKLLPIIKENLPKALADIGGDRVGQRYPVQYQRNAIASGLAAKLVYKEGINVVEAQPMEKLADRAIEYYFASLKVQDVLAKLENQHFGDNAKIKPMVLDLLRNGGARSLVNGF